MRLLALEAGGDVLGAALFDQGRALASAFERAPRRQTEGLAPLVKGLLDSAGLAPAGLEALACGLGPGSFTGLRSSLAFGAGLALARPGLRLLGVPTLEAWAEAFAGEAGRALVLLDARRGQVYRGLLERRGALWAELEAPAMLGLEEARRVGPGGAALLTDLPAGADSPLDAGWRRPGLEGPALALAVGRLALARERAGLAGPAWEPLYMRRSEAEILWERLHGAPGGA